MARGSESSLPVLAVGLAAKAWTTRNCRGGESMAEHFEKVAELRLLDCQQSCDTFETCNSFPAEESVLTSHPQAIPNSCAASLSQAICRYLEGARGPTICFRATNIVEL